MSFPYLGENRELNDETRKEADSGAFINLSDGVTHYELCGPEDGPVVVLVHGFSVPYFIFDPTYEFLKMNGFRVLRYDLFGRGWSDRPHVKYDIHLFVRQLADLLDTLQIRRANLLGLSTGGPITTTFIDQRSDAVASHILIDPIGAMTLKLTKILEALKLPVIGELGLGLFARESLVKRFGSDLFDPQMIEIFQSKYMVQLQFRGFKRAILSTMRNGILDSFYETYERVGKLGKPTLLFWGREDITVPFEHSEKIRMAIPQVEFHAFDHCGHTPHIEKAEIVNPILLRFLKENARR